VQRAAWQSNLQQVIAAAEAQTAGLKIGTTEQERQTYIESHVYLRMLYLMAGQQDRALHAIPGLDPADQEFWQQMFWGVSNYFDMRGIPGTSDRASQTVAQLTSAVQQLQSKANLELRNVSFCQKISSFGNYERFAREEFTPGQPVLLYAAVSDRAAFGGRVLQAGFAVGAAGPHRIQSDGRRVQELPAGLFPQLRVCHSGQAVAGPARHEIDGRGPAQPPRFDIHVEFYRSLTSDVCLFLNRFDDATSVPDRSVRRGAAGAASGSRSAAGGGTAHVSV
jgi:hypothetical protein